jgi:hypothetical protein
MAVNAPGNGTINPSPCPEANAAFSRGIGLPLDRPVNGW